MSARIVIGPTEYLIQTVVSNLTADGRDFSSRAVIFPGKRPAHFLRRELAQRIGGSFIPPKIFSVDEFVLSLYQRIHPETVKEIEAIDAVALLHQVHCSLKERLGGEYFASFDSFIPVGLILFGELEELRLANLSEKRLKELVASLTYNRLFSLAEYYTKFYTLMAEKGFTTRAVRYTEVAARINDIDLSGHAQIIVAGFFKLTHAEQAIFNGLEKNENTLFIFQTDKVEDGIVEPDIQFYKTSDTHGQVFALSALLQERMKEFEKLDEHSVIVLPTADALFPVLHQTLSMLPQDAYNIALGYPIGRTPIYGFLHNLMDLICTQQGELFSTEHYLKFILHPYSKNIRFGQRTDVTRILFHALETTLAKNNFKLLINLRELEQSEEIFANVAYTLIESGIDISAAQLKEHLQIFHANTILPFQHIHSLKEYAHTIINVLEYIYEKSTACQHPLFRPYAEAILQVFLRIEQSLIGQVSFKDAAGYFHFLQQYVALQEVPFPGTPLRGVQVLGLLETRGLHFDDVYMLNVNDNVLPGGMGSDMLLPQQLRGQLGLETRRERDTLSEYYFNLLVRGAKRVHLFYSESDDSDKSRFIERMLWDRQKQERVFSSDNGIKTVNYRVELANKDVVPIIKSQEVFDVLQGFSYSASSFDTYLRCPIKFYYRYIARLQEKEEISTDLDNQDIGLFIHEVLKKYYEPFIGSSLQIHENDTKQMEQLIEEMFVQKFGNEPSGTMYLIKRQIQRQMKALLSDYQQKVLETNDIVIIGLEQKITVRAFGYKFEGRLDRIEQRGNSFVILDYKTGVRPKNASIRFNKLDLDNRDTWNEAISSLQLPIYLLLYGIHTGLSTERIVPAFLFLGESRLSEESEDVFIENAAERAALFVSVQKIIELLLIEINNVAVPFKPPIDLNQMCPRCPYSSFCGTTWVRGWNS